MPQYGNYDAEFNPQISRYDFPQIIATNRVQALIRPVVLFYDGVNQPSGYSAGTVLARRSDGLFGTYAASGSSGLNSPQCVLLVNANPASGGNVAAPAVYKGNLFYGNLLGLDANAVTGLGGRTVNDATGTQLFIF